MLNGLKALFPNYKNFFTKENNTMSKTKKNWVLRVAMLALALTLISTCLLSGTLAKYVSTGTGKDSARVAKWGVEITSNKALFDTEYNADDSAYGAANLSVQSSNGDNLVAPGTEGTAAAFSITGKPEVACNVTVDASASALAPTGPR
jgi:hypothetical protein